MIYTIDEFTAQADLFTFKKFNKLKFLVKLFLNYYYLLNILHV